MTVAPEIVESFVRVRAARPRWGGVPAEHRPASIDAAYQIQKAVYERLAGEGGRRVGYKVAASSPGGQRGFGITEPIYAGLFAATQYATIGQCLATGLVAPAVECEVVFRLRSDLDGAKGLSAADVLNAVDTCHLGCEIVDFRMDVAEAGLATVTVDDFFNAGIVVGPPNPDWRGLDLKNIDAAIEINGTVVKGSSAAVLDAVSSMLWLAGKLAQNGLKVSAGDIVFTGTMVPPTKLPPSVQSITISAAGFAPLTLNGG